MSTGPDLSKLVPGIYKHSCSGLVTTWDIRVKSPNGGDYLSTAIMHTIEHTLAAYLQYHYGNYRIVGVFSMGSQTGFYVLTRFIGSESIFDAILDYIDDALPMMMHVPGANKETCGHFRLHDLTGAKRVMKEYKLNWLDLQPGVARYKY